MRSSPLKTLAESCESFDYTLWYTWGNRPKFIQFLKVESCESFDHTVWYTWGNRPKFSQFLKLIYRLISCAACARKNR